MKQYCSNRTNVENSGDNPQSLCQKMIQGPVLINVFTDIAKIRAMEIM